MQQLVIDGRAFPGRLLNTNAMRGKAIHHSGPTKAWRTLAYAKALAGRLVPVYGPVRIWVEFTFPDNHRRDTANLAPTCKALIDGLVDANILRDDCDGVVEGPLPRRTYPNGRQQLRIVLEPVGLLGLPFGEERLT